MNKGRARSGEFYDQAYLHVFKCTEGQVLTLIEGFDTALANRALWGGSEALPADEDFTRARPTLVHRQRYNSVLTFTKNAVVIAENNLLGVNAAKDLR